MALQAFQNYIQVMELVDTPSLKAFEDVVVDRQVAGFDLSFCGDYFITNQKSQSEAWMNERAEELKNEVRSMFQNVSTDVLQTMNLIDTIQLLGLDYHFTEEIDRALDHLKDIRERVVECYCWSMVIRHEPSCSRARLISTKLLMLITVLDDIYDSYSTLEESLLLTDAIQRHIWKILTQHYITECKWRDDNYVPKLEEHMRVSIKSVGYVWFYCSFLTGMEEAVATKDAFEWFASFPKIVEACAIIVRITNDITSKEREQKREHVASTVDCYMKEYGTSKDVACEKLLGFVEDAWKTINEELLNATGLSREVIKLSLHSSRSTELIYKHVDAFTEPNTTMKENIFSLLVHPIPI
ncbi:(S)-beta-bisabolene synthase-like [Zingiber officinale]|uniref:(S)-beta-bisabolene synthase-like n=1 Tax=Zingiber officinale TaxID=94328 RepID=UPI001C4C8F60|nr:(S)-beta-bisabolene synthase-like [Zingiber officinale]